MKWKRTLGKILLTAGLFFLLAFFFALYTSRTQPRFVNAVLDLRNDSGQVLYVTILARTYNGREYPMLPCLTRTYGGKEPGFVLTLLW